MEEKQRTPVTVRLAKDSGTKNPGNLKVFVTGSEGQVIEEASFKDYEARLKTDADTLKTSRVFIGAALPKESRTTVMNERLLRKSGAFEAVVSISPENVLNIFQLPGNIDNYLNFHFCHITGHLNKNFFIHGTWQNRPVCHARVHICEVDRLLIPWPLIPDPVLVDIRDRFKHIFDLKDKIIRQPRPFPPDPIGPVAAGKIPVQLRQLNATTQLQDELKIRSLPVISEPIQSGLLSNALETIRDTIFDNYRVLYPYFCLWPRYWPWIYRCDEIRTVETDCNGKFSAWYTYFGNDIPDIYIWVEVKVGDHWVTVYRPPLPCNVHWNYNCGTDINITLTDPRIAPCDCDPYPGSLVWIKRVGNGTSLRRIALQPSAPSTPSLFSDARGLTNTTGVEGSSYVSPFTQGFPFYIRFGDNLPTGSVTHYRWKYRRIADANLTPVTETYQPQDGTLSRPYDYDGLNADGVPVKFSGSFPLDVSLGSGKIYKIPHEDAAVDTGIPSAEWNASDVASIVVDAAGKTNGLYEFVLELCNSSGVTQSVSPDLFQVDSLLPSPPNPASTPAGSVDPAYLVHTGGAVTGFRFLLRIDNDHTSCTIFDAVVQNGDGTGGTTDTICGFAQYKNKSTGHMLLKFDAEQPHRYARYNFNVYKGNGGAIAAAGSNGQVPEPFGITIVNGLFTTYQVRPTLGELLGSCDKASFAENIYVTAYHTNGSDRVQSYDSSDIASFAIEPVED